MKLRDLKKGAFLASVTSSDDEFDLRFLDGEYDHEMVTDHITKYTKRGHNFHLLNQGNAINFLYSAAVDKYIYLVQAELMLSAVKLANTSDKKLSGVIEINSDDNHNHIAEMWLNYISRDQPQG
jgi:adenosylhomocysteinase